MKVLRHAALLLVFAVAACARQQPPPTAEDFYARGVRHSQRNELDEAIESFGRAIAAQPRHADAFFERGEAWCSKIEVEKALADFERAVSLAPKRVDFYKRRAQCRIRFAADNGERREVINDLNAGLAVDPNNAELYFFRGLIKHQNAAHALHNPEDAGPDATYEAALADYDRAVELTPGDHVYVSSRAHLKLAFLGDYAGAAADADKAIALKPDEDYNAYAVRARALQSLGKPKEAAGDIRRCRQISANCEAWLKKLDSQLAGRKSRRPK